MFIQTLFFNKQEQPDVTIFFTPLNPVIGNVHFSTSFDLPLNRYSDVKFSKLYFSNSR